MVSVRVLVFAWVFATTVLPAHPDAVLFFGNSFTFGASVHPLTKAGGIPALVEAIAAAKGRQISTNCVAAGGQDWSYLLALPETDVALAKSWDWVVLQDYSSRPTVVGDVKQFMADGKTFSDRIAKKSPRAGILLFETWARPAGAFYTRESGRLSGPDEMLKELSENYGKLRDDLAAKNPGREVRVARVGTAWARVVAQYPGLDLYAADHHHGNAKGYYLAALVIYETLYHDSVKGAPSQFFDGAMVIPPDDAEKLQKVADDVAGNPPIPTAAK